MGLKIGWVKLNRNFLNFPFYQDTNAVRVYVHLKLCANYEAVPWQGLVLQPGQCVTTLQELSKELRISVQQVRGAIQKLKSTRMITVKTTNKFSVFSVHDSCISEGFELKNNTQDSSQNNKKITRKKHSYLLKKRRKESKIIRQLCCLMKLTMNSSNWMRQKRQ